MSGFFLGGVSRRLRALGVLGLACAFGAPVLAAGTPADAASASQGKKIAFMLTAPTTPYPAVFAKAFMARAKHYGMNVTVFQQTFDPAAQAQQMADAIARKFDLIVVMPASEQAIVPSLARAKQANIPIIMVNTPPYPGSEKYYVSFIGYDAHAMGVLTGQEMLAALKASGRDGGKIALITGSLQEGVANNRVKGIREALKANPKAQIVAVEDAQWDPVKSEKIAGQLYARFGSQGGLDLVYGMADNMATAAIKAAEAANIKPGMKKGELVVLGGNCQAVGINAIKAGTMYGTITQLPQENGAQSVDLVNDYFAGKKLKKTYWMPIHKVTAKDLAKWEKPCSY
jgi:ABC-type sugar transport system substrate-binding protein